MNELKHVLKTMYIHQLRWNVAFLFLFVILFFVSTGCAIKHEVEGETVVNHVISIDVKSVYDFYEDNCVKDNTTQEEIDACVDENAEAFLDLLKQISQGVENELQTK